MATSQRLKRTLVNAPCQHEKSGLLTRPWAHKAKAEARKSEAEVEATESEAEAEASHHEAEATN